MNTRKALPRPALRGLLTTTVLLGALAVPLLVATPAHAEEASQSCWENVDTGETGCFDSSLDTVEQIELATGAPVVAVESSEALATARAAAPTATLVNYLLITGWDGTNQSGDSSSYFTTNASICNGFSYSFPNLGAWSDRFESFQGFNGCSARLFEDILLGGTFIGPLASSNDLGAFNNRASSMFVSS